MTKDLPKQNPECSHEVWFHDCPGCAYRLKKHFQEATDALWWNTMTEWVSRLDETGENNGSGEG